MAQPTRNGSVTTAQVAAATLLVRTITGHAVASLTSGAIVVQPVWADGQARTIASVLRNGSAFTHISGCYVDVLGTDASHYGADAFILLAPAAGTFDIDITGSISGQLIGAVISNWDTVNQTTPTANGAVASSGTPNASFQLAGTSSTNDQYVSIGGAYDTVPDLAGGQTALGARVRDTIFSSASWVAQTAGTLNPTMTWTLTAGGVGGNAQSGFSLKGTGGSSPQVTGRSGVALTGISAIDGVTKTGVATVNGLTIS